MTREPAHSIPDHVNRSTACAHGADSIPATRTIAVQKSLLAKNSQFAQLNRARFEAHGVRVINMLSAPGSGKTELLQRTLVDFAGSPRAAVIVGDLATDNDALRLHQTGVPVIQLTTGTVCHLEASMVSQALDALDLDALDLILVENVGNLVCPAAYDLGEHDRVVLMSVTEGEDKPAKYPAAFSSANAVVITKIDLAHATGFDRGLALHHLQRVAPHARVLELSARTGEGLEPWYSFLRGCHSPSNAPAITQPLEPAPAS